MALVAVGCDCLVNVPGQKAWHTHLCENCGTSWTHIAPTPMTQRENRRIHTCHKCGTEVWGFIAVYDGPALPDMGGNAPMKTLVVAGLAGAVVGAGILALFDRRQ